jgi:hypothetical protein
MKTNLPILRGGARCPQRAGASPVAEPVKVGGRVPAPAFSPSLLLLLLPLFLLLTPRAHAQWQSTTYTLKGGWNSIFLHGDASHATIDTLFAARPEIVAIWRWNPNPSQIQFSSSSLIPTGGTPEWSVWTRGGSANTLTTLTGQAAYLVECSGTASNTYSVPIVHKVQPPRSTWVRNGANLLGFPTRLTGTYPTFANYFATFPVAIATNSKIYRYEGGPLGSGNPLNLFNTGLETVDRTQAYWFESAVVGNFYAPLEVSPSNLDGLIYGRNGSLVSVRVRNRTSATVNLTVAPVTSAAAPVGQDQVTAAVPLTYRTFNTTTASYEFTPVSTAIGVVIAPQSTVELFFGVDRAQITGATDALYASLLRFTDGGNLMDVYLPVSARVTSLSGLWIGDVTATNVGNLTLAKFYTCEVTRTVGTVVTTVTSQALQSAPTALGPATLPTGTGGTLAYQWKKSGQTITAATSAQLTLTESERLESGAFGTTTGRSFPLRVILHVDDTGTARLLSQVYMGKLAVSPNNIGLATLETGLKATELASARRISAAHLPPGAVLSTADGTGSVALGQTLVRTVPLAYNAPTNPYVHTYHPDHDNRNARFDAPRTESPLITRDCSFTFTTTPPAGSSAQGWGSSVIGGTYAETITGLHRKTSLVTGTFELRRVSELGSITTN